MRCVVPSTAYYYGAADRQEAHWVIRSRARWLARGFNVLKLARDNNLVNCFWLEVPDPVFYQLTIGSPTSEVIHAFLDLIALNTIVKVKKWNILTFRKPVSWVKLFFVLLLNKPLPSKRIPVPSLQSTALQPSPVIQSCTKACPNTRTHFQKSRQRLPLISYT